MRRARRVASLTIGVGILYVAPTRGWWLFGLLASSALMTETLERRMHQSRHPEYHAVFTIFWSQLMVAAAVALTDGPHSPLMTLMAVPTAFVATRFRIGVSYAAAATAILLLALSTLAVHPAATIAHPEGVIFAVIVLIGISSAMHALNSAATQFRATAVLDSLTGLLNRQGLEPRFEELAEQARLTSAPISLLICDIDHFKEVNDRNGHAVGDAVLRDMGYELRKQLRNFELVYRTGGDEFVVLLPGAAPPLARALAERLGEAVRARRPQGIPLTLSVGVSTRWGAEATFLELFTAADRALYRAKAAGRSRVCVDEVGSVLGADAVDPEVAARRLAVPRPKLGRWGSALGAGQAVSHAGRRRTS